MGTERKQGEARSERVAERRRTRLVLDYRYASYECRLALGVGEVKEAGVAWFLIVTKRMETCMHVEYTELFVMFHFGSMRSVAEEYRHLWRCYSIASGRSGIRGLAMLMS